MILIIFLYLINVHSFYAWPCWLGGKCEEEKSQEAPTFQGALDEFDKFIFNLVNPYCWRSGCFNEDKSENKAQEPETSNWWPTSCEEQDVPQQEKNTNFFSWFNKDNEEVVPEKKHWYCNLKRSSYESYQNLKDYLNAAKPQEAIIQNFYSSELSPYCWFTECCNFNSIPGNTQRLKSYLEKYVYGQPLLDIIINAIDSHWDANVEQKKPLVMSFHGGVGTGKNYVADFLAKSLFKLGTKSKHVHHFSGRVHLSLDSPVYKENLYNWLKGNVTDCSRQLFIFDELDKMPESLLNAIKPMLDYKDSVDGADYRNAIFIFISNTGSSIIENHYVELLNQKKQKTDIELKDFEKLISDGVFHEKGGFHQSDTIKYNLIDHYIPFLPLEKEDIIKCIIDAFILRGIRKPLDAHVEMVLEYLERTHTVQGRMVYTNGCKQVFTKVGFIAAKYYKKVDKQAVDFAKNDL